MILRLFFLLLIIQSNAVAQEFLLYKNGLIYSERSINHLKRVGDSLNLRFKSCNNSKNYYSFGQTYGEIYYCYDSIQIPKAISLIEKGCSRNELELLLWNKTHETIDSSLLIRYNYFDEDSNCIQTQTAELGHSDIIEYESHVSLKNVRDIPASDGGSWHYNIRYSWRNDRSLYIYYIQNPFEYKIIPVQYNSWIAYSECMIDTNTTVFFKDAVRVGGLRGNSCADEKMIEQDKLINFVKQIKYSKHEPLRPERYRGNDTLKQKSVQEKWNKYLIVHQKWEGKRDQYILTHIRNKDTFNLLMKNAYDEALSTKCIRGNATDILSRFYSKEAALNLERSQIVIGICSFDSSPRTHLKDISMLAAESGNWNVFLRAHLDLINDRVSRNSDNSLAYKYRGTYIKELEVLDLNLKELLPGTNFRITNSPNEHYYGSITKTAKMMAFSSKQEEYKQLLLSIAADKNLDNYNRMIFAFIANNFIYYAYKDEERRAAEHKTLESTISDLPVFLQEMIAMDEE